MAFQSQRDDPMPAQANGLGGEPTSLDIQARRAGTKLVAANRLNDPCERELGPPRWGFVCCGVTVTQADGLGWHRAATLWRKKSKTRNESHTVTKKTSLKIRAAEENRDGKAIGASGGESMNCSEERDGGRPCHNRSQESSSISCTAQKGVVLG